MLTTCEICGMSYVSDLPGDRAQHRAAHAKVVRILSPKPLRRFINRLAKSKDPEVVTFASARWLQEELYLRARQFKREFGYDFTQWSPYGDEQRDAYGFLFAEKNGVFQDGAIVGACVFRWRSFSDAQARWTLDWVWIAPDARRRGLLGRRWPAYQKRFGDFYIMPPVSPAMSAFAQKHGYKGPNRQNTGREV
jgi:hypothetical protein